jgi:serine/threonine protein kinase
MEKYCPRCFKEYEGDIERCPDDETRLVATVEENLVGRTLDERYKILSLLGKGGMGIVYVAEQAMIGRKVALKVLRMEMVRDKSAVQRFLVEAKAISRLRSSHTITLHDFGVTKEGLLYYTMEMLEGQPLSDLIKAEGAMPYQRAAEIILQALDSLEEAHETGILHRDLKPDNLFISQHRGKDFVSVLDFGIAKLVGDTSMEAITQTGMICGTPAYLSPEQAMGRPVCAASDIYSLAIVFYELLAGSPPFKKTTAMEVLMSHVSEVPQPVSIKNPGVTVPTAIEQLIQKALVKTAEERIGSTAEFRTLLEQALAGPKDDAVPLPALSIDEAGMQTLAGTQDMALVQEEPSSQTPAPAAVREFAGDSPQVDGANIETAITDGSKEASGGNRGLFIGAGFAATILVVMLLVWQPWSGKSGVDSETVHPAPPKAQTLVPTEVPAEVDRAQVAAPAGSPAIAGDVEEEVQLDAGRPPEPEIVAVDVKSAAAEVLVDVTTTEPEVTEPPVADTVTESATLDDMIPPPVDAVDISTVAEVGIPASDVSKPTEKAGQTGGSKATEAKVEKKVRKKKTARKAAEKATAEKQSRSKGLKFRNFGTKTKKKEEPRKEEPKKKGLQFRPVK